MRPSWLVTPLTLALAGCGLLLEPLPDASTPRDDGSTPEDAAWPDGDVPNECAAQADFVACNPGAPEGERWVCLAGSCRRSVCGDGFFDVASEVCDDGNAVAGDGCDPDCTPSCETDDACVDDNACNGVEACDADTHACVAGAALEDGRACGGAEARVCRSGFCAAVTCGDMLLDPGEQCDDGNTNAGDGCDPDCTFSCVSNTDCPETACRAGTCDLDGHTCALAPRDGDGDGFTRGGSCGGPDCDDGDPSINPGVSRDVCNSVDDDCDGLVDEDDPPFSCWTDADGDGHSDLPLIRVCSADGTCPAGFVDTPISDCYDSATDPLAADVNPDQVAYFATPYTTTLGGSSFDYDCDGVGVQEYPTPATCSLSTGGTCPMGSGFQVPVPPCGASGTFVTCSGSAGMCLSAVSTAVQRCR